MVDETHSSWNSRDFNQCLGSCKNYWGPIKTIERKSQTKLNFIFTHLTFKVDKDSNTLPGFPPSWVILYSKTSSTKDVTGMKTPLEPARWLSHLIHLSLNGKYLGPGKRRATPFIICMIIYNNGWRS